MVWVVAPAAFLSSDFHQIGGDDVDVIGRAIGGANFNRGVLELGVIGDGHVGGHGPGRGGPDEAVNFAARQRGVEFRGVGSEGKTHPDGGAGVVRIFDFGFGQGGAILDAPVDRLEAFINVAAVEEIDERASDYGLVMRAHGEIRIVPLAQDAETLEIGALDIDVLFGVLAAGAADLDG